jgi:hypothetical protein
MERWSPRVELTKREQMMMKRLTRVRALFGFLRLHRHELFDAGLQDQLAEMYRDTGAGDEPHPPAMLCMVALLQGYTGASDAEAVELAVMDLRWQMVLDCLGAEEPPFSQGALQAFRERLIAHGMDRTLLEKSVALVRAKTISGADGKALSKAVRVAVDSRPLAGAGRVEDTINLLGHAARTIVQIVSKITERRVEDVCRSAGIPLLLAPSIKAGLDIDWSDPKQKVSAIQIVEQQVSSLHRWVERHLDEAISTPLAPYIQAIAQVRAQDLETTKDGVRIRHGVAHDRRISIEDAEMRHGRKSKSKRFDGYKEHIARDLDHPLILACAVTPANHPEEEGAAPIRDDILAQGLELSELHIDRAYVNSPVVGDLLKAKGKVFAKPWRIRAIRPGMFTKLDFKIDLRAGTITCPQGQIEPFEPGETVEFDPEACGSCPQRGNCTSAASGRGRTVSIAQDEALQNRFRRLQQSPSGRQNLRARVQVEHALAHVAARKGDRARYIGVRKNLFDLRRAAVIQNLEAAQRIERELAALAA